MTLDLTHLPDDQRAIQSRCYHPTDNFIEFPAEALEQSLDERFEEQVLQHPNRVAVKSNAEELTYSELNARANRIAHAIIEKRGEAREPVPLLFELGVSAIVATLGALKAGKFYSPLDASYPIARLQYLVEDLEAGLIVTNDQNLKTARELAEGVDIVNIDDLPPTVSSDDPGISTTPEDYAWVTYTSGSTGQPKGVIHTNRNVMQFTQNYTNYLHTSPEDRSLLLFAYGGTACSHQTFATLLTGAALYPYDVKADGFDRLADFVDRREITICMTVPTVFRRFMETLAPERLLPTVRLIVFMGETTYVRDLAPYNFHFSEACVLVNRLGSSETGSALFYFVDQSTKIPNGIIPVGYPLQGNQIFVLDEDRNVITNGEVGEIAVRSQYLSPGYWRKPDRTAASYLPDITGGTERTYLMGDMGTWQPDGSLVYKGRKDFQVKVRGFRVEVDEIELVLSGQDGVKEAVAALHQDESGDGRLVAYLVPADDVRPSVRAIRQAVSAVLPSFMVPSAFVVLDKLPVLPSGNVDRRALPPPGSERPQIDTPLVEPRTPIEEVLSAIWADVLSLDEVGVNDDFLELGGDSLKATRIISRVISTFQVEVQLEELFDSPTISDMALVVAQYQAVGADEDDIAALLTDLETMTDEQARQEIEEG